MENAHAGIADWARDTFETGSGPAYLYRLDRLAEREDVDLSRIPFSVRVLLESVLRNVDGEQVTEEDLRALARYDAERVGDGDEAEEVPFMPARVLLQDFTGVPAIVDLAALRSSMDRQGGDAGRINPMVPSNLVIDHSVQVDAFGSSEAFQINSELEFRRNRERYEFLRWGKQAFENFDVVPPSRGIVHQVNLEYLATGVQTREREDDLPLVYPDSLVGTDSHTTMINGLGVAGWGVGGIEAEAVMLGQPLYMLTPEVVGFKLSGALSEGATATDLVLTVTEMLREAGVVGKFVEFFGPGIHRLSIPDRATIANMSPEYGATMGYFPLDEESLNYMRRTGRPEELVEKVERYARAQGLFHTDETPDPVYSELLELDLADVVPSVAGPKRPQDRIQVPDLADAFEKSLTEPAGPTGFGLESDQLDATGTYEDEDGETLELKHGDLAIAAITSCTNTSNPSVMIAAGLLAKRAVEKGLEVPSYVKTSLAPGSRVVTEYLKDADLMPALEALGFDLVGYGCTTCIGNSGPLPDAVSEAIEEGDLVVSGVLSGNRNFEGRIHSQVKANYLASPPLVVAYALAGTVDIDLTDDPLGEDADGNPVYLEDIWPSSAEVLELINETVKPELFREQYEGIEESNERWNEMDVPEGKIYEWDEDSTYIQEPPFFTDVTAELPEPPSIEGARVLVKVGDSVTTDHISPAGAIPPDTPAGRYLMERGIEPKDFNSYGSRRGNHEVMMRGTFANIRLRNEMAPGTEGGYTTHLPSGEQTSIYDAAMRYIDEGTPLLVFAGTQYGTGSSRDWAAKGTLLLGVKAVIAESYERIHRSNLVGMGVLPLQFREGENLETYGLTGREVFDIEMPEELRPGEMIPMIARSPDEGDKEITVPTVCRLDSSVEVSYYRHGGILHYVLRNMLRETEGVQT